MQIMPHTAIKLARELNVRPFSTSSVFDPKTNLTLAGHYLQALWSKFQGQVPLIAAAYNGGPHNIARWLQFRGQNAELDEFVEEIPFTESRRYAKKISRLLALHQLAYCNKDDYVLPRRLDPTFSQYPGY